MEVNAALLVAKLALVVLVTAASAIPAVLGAKGAALYGWWVLLTLGYAAIAAYLQSARVAAYIELWRAAEAR
jgi:hypothetical protein